MVNPERAQRNETYVLATIVVGIVLLWANSTRFKFNFNTGHMDEYDYLFVGNRLLAGVAWPTHSYIFGSDLNWVLFALADTLTNSVASIRGVSALFGLLSIMGMYFFTKVLWRNNWAAFLSAALLAMDAAHMFSSKYISYDILSFCLFVWALPCIILACSETVRYKRWLALGAALLSMSVLSKYTLILNLPLIALLVAMKKPKRALVGTFIISTVLVSYAMKWREELIVLLSHQVNGTHGSNTTKSDLIARILEQQTILYCLLIGAMLVMAIKFRTNIRKALVLILLSSLMPLYHLYSENLISLYKHLVYNSLFILPIVGYALAILTKNRLHWILKCAILIAVLFITAIHNNAQLRLMEKGFPNSTTALTALPTMLPSDTILSENPYLFRYKFLNIVPQSNIKESNWFDNNHDGKFEPLDIEQAIWDRKFKYVYLNDQIHQNENARYRDLLEKRGYQILLNTHYIVSQIISNNTKGYQSLYQRPSYAQNVNVQKPNVQNGEAHE